MSNYHPYLKIMAIPFLMLIEKGTLARYALWINVIQKKH